MEKELEEGEVVVDSDFTAYRSSSQYQNRKRDREQFDNDYAAFQKKLRGGEERRGSTQAPPPPPPHPRPRYALPSPRPSAHSSSLTSSVTHPSSSFRDRYHSDKKEKERWIYERRDAEEFLRARRNDLLDGRYRVEEADLGEGTFGTVCGCYDQKRHRSVAIKIVRSIKKYKDAAKIELKALQCVTDADPGSRFNCIVLYDWFCIEDHVCLVFPLCSMSLYDYLRPERTLSLEKVAVVAYQLSLSLTLLRSLSFTHTDIKPENVLLVNERRITKEPLSVEIRLCDFGSATHESRHHTTIVSTRPYRAPEIVKGNGWSYPADIFSFAALLTELFLGFQVFDSRGDSEHLLMIDYFLGREKRVYLEDDRKIIEASRRMRRFRASNVSSSSTFQILLSDCLQVDPSMRPSAVELLSYRFFRSFSFSVRMLEKFGTLKSLARHCQAVDNFINGRRQDEAIERKKRISTSNEVFIEKSKTDQDGNVEIE